LLGLAGPKACANRRQGVWRLAAFTLSEVVIALAILSLLVGGLVTGYVLSAQRAEWSAYSLAAHSLAMQRLEQTRAAKWDPLSWPPVDELVSSNFPPVVDLLDVPVSGTNAVVATTTTTITTVSTDPPVKMIRVDTVWPFMDWGLSTNTLVTYRAPDQ
jgi:type II secretory pathway pseudopilin PulG